MRTLSYCHKLPEKLPQTGRMIGLLVVCWICVSGDPVSSADDVATPGLLEEITVTAQRREQSLQDVPVSVTAFDANEIRDRQIEDLSDYFLATPNVSFLNNGNRGRTQLSIRGVGNIVGRQNALGIYVDGFNIAPGSSIRTYDPNLLDVERIEILRGPQGTLFGRNATAGAVNITSAKPADEFQARLDVEGSSFNAHLLRGSVNVPIISDHIALRLSAYDERSDGFIRNVGPAGGRSDIDAFGVRAALRLKFFDRLTIDLSARHNDLRQGANAVVDRDPTRFGIPDRPWSIDLNRDSFTDIEGEVYVANIEYEFDNWRIISTTGLIENKYREFNDRDFTPDDLEVQDSTTRLGSFSQEVRVEAEFGQSADLVTGVIYAGDDTTIRSIRDQGVDTFLGPGNGFDNVLREKFVMRAVFADLTLRLVPQVEVTLGNRFSKTDYKRYDINIFNTRIPAFPPFFPETISSFSAVNLGQVVSDRDSSPRGVLGISLTPDIYTYVSASRGFKSGGGNGILLGIDPTFDKEIVWNYELGLKSEFFNSRLRVNAAAFLMDWEDLQVANFDGGRRIVQNAPAARSRGVELEVDALPFERLEMSLGIGFLDATFVDHPEAFSLVWNAISGTAEPLRLDGFKLPRAPEWTANAAIQYTQPLFFNWRFFSRLEWFFVDEYFQVAAGEFIFKNATTRTDRNATRIRSYQLANLRLGLEKGSFRLSAFAENLFNQSYFTGLRGLGADGLVDPQPRRVGLRLSYAY
ncbi:MAG: TonB-dependent receptor [Pseudomonadota bacterium]